MCCTFTFTSPMKPASWCLPASKKAQPSDQNRVSRLGPKRICTKAPTSRLLIMQINPKAH